MSKIVQIAVAPENNKAPGIVLALMDCGRIVIGTMEPNGPVWRKDVTPSQKLLDKLASEKIKQEALTRK